MPAWAGGETGGGEEAAGASGFGVPAIFPRFDKISAVKIFCKEKGGRGTPQLIDGVLRALWLT